MSVILNIKDIQVHYGSIKAIKGISLTIKQGDIISLIGANGAGKSSLLKAIMGLVPLARGQVYFENDLILESQNVNMRRKGFIKQLSSFSTDKIVALGLSLVPEGRRVFKDLTVYENLEMGAFLLKDKSELLRRIKEQFDYFPILRERSSQRAGSLSGGEQQMLAIARALMSEPQLLLLDEPGLGLAPLIVNDIFRIIKTINQEKNVTVFLVEQNAKKALEVSSYGYVMETGLISLSETSEKLLSDDKVRSAYLGEN